MEADVDQARDPIEVALQIELYGALNPAIFRTKWFIDQGLLRASDLDLAEEVFPDDDFVQIETPDLLIEVTRQRFALLSRNETYNLSHRDLVSNLFELLQHTPLRSLSISRLAWFAPPRKPADGSKMVLAWETLANTAPWQSVLDSPALDRVTVFGSPSVGEYTAELTIEDSARVDAPLLIRCIYTRDLLDDQASVGPELQKDWADLLSHSSRVTAHFDAILWQSASDREEA